MSIKHRDLERMLMDNGFKFVRKSKHPCYSDGITTIALPNGSKVRYGMDMKIRAEMKRAIKKREEKLAVKQPFNPLYKNGVDSPHSSKPVKFESRNPRDQMEFVDDKRITNPGKDLSKSVKYSKEERHRMRSRIVELRDIGHGVGEVHEIMKMEGYKSPTGGEFMFHHVSNALQSMREMEKTASKRVSRVSHTPPQTEVIIQPKTLVRAAPTVQTLPQIVLDILTNPDFTDTKKVRLLLAYAED